LTGEVKLATDGADRYMLRFEVAEGSLRGTRFAVTSHGGVVSAVVVPPGPELSLQLEQLLDEARATLEGRGIDVGGMDVRTGEEPGRQTRSEPDDDTPRRPVVSTPLRRCPDELGDEPLDYFI